MMEETAKVCDDSREQVENGHLIFSRSNNGIDR